MLPQYKARFQEEKTDEYSVFCQSLKDVIPKNHKVRAVIAIVKQLDITALEEKYSYLGRRGYPPRAMLTMLVYASIIKLHTNAEIERQLETDLALQFACYGHKPKAWSIGKFKKLLLKTLPNLIDETAAQALKAGMIDIDKSYAVDAMRVRSASSSEKHRSKYRSTKRVKELENKLTKKKLTKQEKEKIEKRLKYHQQILLNCQEKNVNDYSETSPSARSIHFPNGVILPGHKLTAIAAGGRYRIAIAAFVNGEASDTNCFTEAFRLLEKFFDKHDKNTDKRDFLADTGYFMAENCKSVHNHEKIESFISPPEMGQNIGSRDGKGFFKKRDFDVKQNGEVICPAGHKMHSQNATTKKGKIIFRKRGTNCGSCSLRNKCISGKARYKTIDMQEGEWHANKMRHKMASEKGKEKYKARMGVIEPVFAYIGHHMNYKRTTAFDDETIQAEGLLKVLSNNIAMLISARGGGKYFFVVFFWLIPRAKQS